MSEQGAKPAAERQPGPSFSERLSKGALAIAHWLTLALAACVILVVLAGAACLFRLVPTHDMIPKDLAAFYKTFQDVLSALLLLVVGLELAVMLVLRRPESLVEIMFFVIARKVLIKTDHVYELLIAVAAIAALFAVEKYLMAGDGLFKPKKDV